MILQFRQRGQMPDVAGMDHCELSLQNDDISLLMQALEGYRALPYDGNLIHANLP